MCRRQACVLVRRVTSPACVVRRVSSSESGLRPRQACVVVSLCCRQLVSDRRACVRLSGLCRRRLMSSGLCRRRVSSTLLPIPDAEYRRGIHRPEYPRRRTVSGCRQASTLLPTPTQTENILPFTHFVSSLKLVVCVCRRRKAAGCRERTGVMCNQNRTVTSPSASWHP